MKRKVAIILLLVVLTAIGYLGFSIYSEFQQKQAIQERISDLPEFTLTNLEGEQVESGGMVEQKPLILTYFNTECRFCKAEIASIKEHELIQERAAIFLLSDEPENILKEFARTMKLDSLQAVQVFRDSSREVKNLFGVNGVPYTFVYDANGKLLEKFKGETRAGVLYDLIK
ncbi:redoxin domain-containing protein [Aliifodinibius sp. S!AR15-10]|uniref:TlpA family protein disulfide reductase n=1 Tax=Aliifodinibius sp. S!AR15-10 TaxID=2950437 RepID=UPI00285ABC89|nr:redoxin domain-containing protein [Aliifodinibius sp. S!AR15-10]MDR8393096.1 redoxin domain-containing protein [Aliifodinibius sp. S!AR15-10]